ncbi:AbrB/MazE/SpoVT family DNA-binding domain-containing protein [Candidatus Palauibacter sp.]|uniref:AbrB/MazE/SpoVT family DNA-binding domain-containing protein n=1 Tax=Candidatus Palauibacter sp. TaxID=3101350 RepID=UPI003B01D3F7
MDKTRLGRTVELLRIGRSRGILLSRRLLNKYGWTDSLSLEETDHGIVLHRAGEGRQSWERTYRAMAATDEDWSDLEATAGDGLVR